MNVFIITGRLTADPTLKQINQRYFLWDNLPEYLENVTKNNCFKISYWQCCEKPAYQIKNICFDGELCIGGIASWSGYYEGYLSINDNHLKNVYPSEELYIHEKINKFLKDNGYDLTKLDYKVVAVLDKISNKLVCVL